MSADIRPCLDCEPNVVPGAKDGGLTGCLTNGQMAVDGMASIHSYAHLISQALRSIPSRRMVLSDIYDWFERHTDKAKVKTSTSKLAWKNSIRYNLSINKVRIYSMGEE